jgi:hypothetical protein
MNACILVLADTAEDIRQILSRCQEREKGPVYLTSWTRYSWGLCFTFTGSDIKKGLA